VYVIADEVSTTDVVVFNDADTDGLSNEEEKTYGTDPEVADTDGDGYSDGVEIEGGFDPLKPAPGDRIISDETVNSDNSVAGSDENNLTGKATDALAEVIAAKGEDGSITSEDFSTVLEDVMTQGQEEVVLPEIDSSSIKIKKIATRLSDEEREVQSREDVVQYLTLVSYILLSNLPTPVRDESQFEKFLSSTSSAMLTSLVSGNFAFLDESERRAKSALEEINQLEVPEKMVSTHLKAIQLLTYVTKMKENIQLTAASDDPLAQMASFSKILGLVASLQGFMLETEEKLTQYGIQKISLDL
jgi:hypothetical protein